MPSAEARDLEQIDALVARFFSAFDNRDGRAPTLAEIAALFAPGAIVARDAGAACEVCTVAEFAEPRIRLLGGGELVAFHEWETGATTQVLGAVAERRSTYAKSGTLRGAPYDGRGRKLFHFGRFADGWRITALAWSDDA
jgi:hypothetical protein